MSKTVLIPIDLSHAEAGKEMIGAAKRIGGEDVQIILIYVVENIPTYAAAELPGRGARQAPRAPQGAHPAPGEDARL